MLDHAVTSLGRTSVVLQARADASFHSVLSLLPLSARELQSQPSVANIKANDQIVSFTSSPLCSRTSVRDSTTPMIPITESMVTTTPWTDAIPLLFTVEIHLPLQGSVTRMQQAITILSQPTVTITPVLATITPSQPTTITTLVVAIILVATSQQVTTLVLQSTAQMSHRLVLHTTTAAAMLSKLNTSLRSRKLYDWVGICTNISVW